MGPLCVQHLPEWVKDCDTHAQAEKDDQGRGLCYDRDEFCMTFHFDWATNLNGIVWLCLRGASVDTDRGFRGPRG